MFLKLWTEAEVRWPGLSTSNRMRVWNRSEPMVIFQRNGTVLAGVARKRELHGGVQFEWTGVRTPQGHDDDGDSK
jgi:hypothetical protein